MVTGVTVVTGPGAQGGPGRVPRGPQGAQEGTQKGSNPETTVKEKEGAVCVLEGTKEEKRKVKGSWGPLGPLGDSTGALRAHWGLPKGPIRASSGPIWASRGPPLLWVPKGAPRGTKWDF
jgi:hypothetical protein